VSRNQHESRGTKSLPARADRSASDKHCSIAPRAGISRRRPPIAVDRAIERHLRTISKRPGALQILSRLADAVVSFDVEWRYVYLNRQAELNHKRPVGELLGQVVWDVFVEGRQLETYQRYLRAMERQEEDVFEEYMPMFGRWFEQRLLPSPTGLTVVARDITEWREIEVERTRLARALAAVQAGAPEVPIRSETAPAVGNPIRTFTTFFARAGRRTELVDRFRHSDMFLTAAQNAGALTIELQIADDPAGPIVITALWRSAADYERWVALPIRAELLAPLEPLIEEICVEKYEVVKRASHES
jgi:hypothetical protein